MEKGGLFLEKAIEALYIYNKDEVSRTHLDINCEEYGQNCDVCL